MLILCALTLLVVMAVALVIAVRSPTVFDRILAVNLFGTKTVLFIAVVGFLFGRPDFLDIALVYALTNFVSVVGVLRYFEYVQGEYIQGVRAGKTELEHS